MKFDVMRLDRRHEGDWRELWREYNAFYGRAGPTALPDHVTDATWSRLHDDDEPMLGLVAAIGARVVGFCHLVFHRTTIGVNNTCYLQDLFVASAARRLGIASALIETAYETARSHRALRVYWQTHESNLGAIALYEQLAERSGFIVFRRSLAVAQPS